MKHPIIDKILTEWAYRVHDGKPNKENPSHLLELKKTMEELNLPKEFIFEFVQNLFEDKQLYARSKKSRKVVPFTNKENWKNKIASGEYEKVSDEEAEQELEKQGEEKPDKKEPSKEEQPPPTPKVTNIDKHQFKGDESEEETFEDGTEEQETHLRDTDHKTTDVQLNFSKAEAKAQAKQKGEKGVGLGTPESRAGEAAVHYAMRELTAGGKSIDDVKKVLMGLANDKDKVLDLKWAKAAVNTAKWISEVYGSDIKEVVWDTPEGRELIGVQGHGTSSDMFIQTQEGKNIGISLKQTTAVFLLNGGYAKQHDLLVSSLDETLSEEELENFKAATSIDTYWNGDGSGNSGFIGGLRNISDEFLNNKDFKKLIKERVQHYRSNSEVYQKSNIFDSDKYKKYIDQTELIIEKLPHVNSEQMKYIAKIMKDPVVKKQFPQFYDNLRGQEVILTKKILGQAKSSPNVAEGLKKLCLKGMHAEDILFSSSAQLDEFITLYGNDPAVELDKGILLNMFDMKDEYEKYLSISDVEDPEGYMREEQKETMMAEFNKRLIIDMKDDAKSGEIKIKHSGPPAQEFHLFGIKARAKPPGSSPGLEMSQTSFMGNVIKEGTADISKWRPSTKKRYVSTRMKELSEELTDASTEQKQAIQEEVKALREL